MIIGVLALQGAFAEHIQRLKQLGTETRIVRLPHDLSDLDGLIIPGGESTTIGKLLELYDLMAPVQHFALEKPVWGTCAGMILMAKDIGAQQPILGVMDIVVERNAFGRQIDSFITKLIVPDIQDGVSKPFPAVFIRAPKIVEAKGTAKIIAKLENNTPVAVRQGKLLATAFHPELTDDLRFHEYFLSFIT
jgi:5'-phosphate synthase pdxT subunit